MRIAQIEIGRRLPPLEVILEVAHVSMYHCSGGRERDNVWKASEMLAGV